MTGNAAAAVVMAWVAAAGAIAVAVACIPDLPSPSQVEAGVVVLAAPAGYCGDGYIDMTAGEQCDPGTRPGDAGIAGCTADCKFECSGGLLWDGNDHCYETAGGAWSLVAPTNGFQSANAVCQSAGPGNGHVVTFASENEFQAVTGAFDAGAFWVGLKLASATGYTSLVPFEPGWASTCSGCFAHTTAPDAGLAPYVDASADGGPIECIVASAQPQQPWRQYPCSVGFSRRLPPPQVICEFEPIGRRSTPCEAGICIDLVATHPAKRYVYQERRASPDNAVAGCQAIGGQLVVLQSSDEREQLWHELSHVLVTPPGVWIGLSDVPGARRQPATWKWDDGKDAGDYPSEWGDLQPVRGQPNGFAGSTLSTRAFLLPDPSVGSVDDTLARNDALNATLPYVCEITADTLAAWQSAQREAGVDARGD